MIPVNEMGVVVVFSQVCEARGWEIIKIQPGYPDVEIRRRGETRIYRAEFEFEAGSFIDHLHDPRRCDLIICWINDLPGFPMTIWELSNWTTDEIIDLSDDQKYLLSMQTENKGLRRKVKQLETALARKNQDITEKTIDVRDWRNLPDEDRQLVGKMTTNEIVHKYGVCERTAQNWRLYSKS